MWHSARMNPPDPRRARTLFTTALGRGLLPSDESAGQSSLLITHGLWLRRFGGATDVIGRSVAVNGRSSTIVGVLPPSFMFPISIDVVASIDMDAKHAGVLAYAKALHYWQHRHAFCGACGHPNRLESAGHRLVCSNEECGRQSFPRIDPAIIVLVTQGDACLLGHNANWPPRRFSTLAGFVEPGESLEDAVVREVFEESGVRLREIHYVSSQPWPFPASAMCGFYAEAATRECRPSDELAEVRWFSVAELDAAVAADEVRLPPPVSIAFRLIADWYQQQCGRDLEPLVRRAGNWLRRER